MSEFDPHNVDSMALANSLGAIVSRLTSPDASTTNVGPRSDTTGLLSTPQPLDILKDQAANAPLTNMAGQVADQQDANKQAAAATTSLATGNSLGASGGDTANPVPGGAKVDPEGGFGPRGNNVHQGYDLQVPNHTTLVAAINGTVTHASNDDPHGYGNMLEITGANGLSVRYGHLAGFSVHVGDTVKAGQVVGQSGGVAGEASSGDSTGPHLHFEVRQNGTPIDPGAFLGAAAKGAPFTGAEAAPNLTITRTGPDRSIAPQDAADTAVDRVAGIMHGQDPGSQNKVQQVTTSESVAPGASGSAAGTADTSNLAGMDKYYAQVLQGVGAPVTDATLQFMRAWQKAEGGDATNPFNTTQDAPGATNFNSVGVKRYASQESGITATTTTLMNGLYGNIIAALRAGADPKAMAQALADSPWGTGSLVMRILGG